MCIRFTERLQALRREHNLTQQNMADLLEIKLRSYQYYEGGGRRPDWETLIALADYFHVSIDYLIGRTEER